MTTAQMISWKPLLPHQEGEQAIGRGVDREAGGDRQREAVDEKHRAERRDEGRHSQLDRDEAVEQSDRATADQGEDEGDDQRHPGIMGKIHDERREREDHTPLRGRSRHRSAA